MTNDSLEYFALDEHFVASAQILPNDLSAIAAAGFGVVVCNRPDHEEPGQPTAAEIAAACETLDLVFHHIPMLGVQIPDGGVETVRELVDGSRGRVFAYCRSGQRSAFLWQVAKG